MIRVELGEEIERQGKWRWTVPALSLSGISRMPLLDACREIKSMGGDPFQNVGLFREGMEQPDLSCRLDVGAAATVNEDGPRFAKWTPHPRSGT
jgi:hypothetical protein